MMYLHFFSHILSNVMPYIRRDIVARISRATSLYEIKRILFFFNSVIEAST